jgi:site-specific DNA-methyltransferase (adenine-specific)
MEHLAFAPGVDLYLGDSRDVLRHLDQEGVRADVTVCDPPYGIDYVPRSQRLGRIANDRDPDDIAGWSVPAMARLMKRDTAMYLFTGWQVLPVWKDAMRSAGLSVTSIVWDKVLPSGLGSPRDHMVQTEWILLGEKGSPHGRRDDRDTIWTEAVRRDKRSQRHQTPKPPPLMQRALLNHSDEGDLVVDAFMGHGPVGVAAVNVGRRYIGVELDPGHFATAVENIQRAMQERAKTFTMQS